MTDRDLREIIAWLKDELRHDDLWKELSIGDVRCGVVIGLDGKAAEKAHKHAYKK